MNIYAASNQPRSKPIEGRDDEPRGRERIRFEAATLAREGRRGEARDLLRRAGIPPHDWPGVVALEPRDVRPWRSLAQKQEAAAC